jgi:hypothetical protein
VAARSGKSLYRASRLGTQESITLTPLIPEHEGADFTLQASAQVLLSGFAGASSGILAKVLGYEGLLVGAGVLGTLVLVIVRMHASRTQG